MIQSSTSFEALRILNLNFKIKKRCDELFEGFTENGKYFNTINSWDRIEKYPLQGYEISNQENIKSNCVEIFPIFSKCFK